MKKYVIVKSVNETDRIAKFHAESGNRYIGKYHGSYCAIVDEYDTLYAANNELTDIAMTDAESDCNINPNCHSWALFCASIPNRAGSDKRTHYRWYSDGDCTRYEVYDTESNDTEIERAIYDVYHNEEDEQ